MASSDQLHEPAVLTSWKEVAAYLGKGVRTVQRWEKYDRLPVRRLSGTSKIIVHRTELDTWLHSRAVTMQSKPGTNLHSLELAEAIERARALRETNILLRQSVLNAATQLAAECRRLTFVCTGIVRPTSISSGPPESH